MAAIAISFFVIIVAVSISGGFRHELRSGISSLAGDIRVTNPDLNYYGDADPLPRADTLAAAIEKVHGVGKVVPAVYRAGIVKAGNEIAGVMFKGTPDGGDSLGARIPSRLADMLSLSVGDYMTAYYVGERVRVRKWHVDGIYRSVLSGDDGMIVFCGISDMRRLNGWTPGEASAIEVIMGGKSDDTGTVSRTAAEIGALMLDITTEDENAPVALSAMSEYPQIFSWLDLIDYNVFIILILMVIVAGFNMISGLLILLFRNISTIGILKSMGMRDRAISEVFLRVSSVLVLKGMAIGNGLALLFCLIQGTTKVISLNPDNYFLSYVPVHVDPVLILSADVAAWVGITVLLLLPCLYVSGIDPAKTVRAQ